MPILPNFAPPHISTEQRSDGSILIRSNDALDYYTPSIIHSFRAGSQEYPDRLLVAERGPDDQWQKASWGEIRIAVDRLAQGLINRHLDQRPVFILSGNSRRHLIVMLAAMTVGAPVVSASVAYSLQSTDYARLRWMAEFVQPGLVFAETAAFQDAARVVTDVAKNAINVSSEQGIDSATTLNQLGAEPTPQVNEFCSDLTADTMAKIMFTSGSTGRPKGVITTHGMLSANQQQIRQVWPFLAGERPVLLDWLPWSHTFGGNHNLNMVLTNGGTLWIDDGRPSPELITRTVRNLADAKPTIYFGVPTMYNVLLPYLESDATVASAFLARLRLGFVAAAALPQDLWRRLETLARIHGSNMQMTASWGLTETSPAATMAHYPIARSDNLGVPLPGMDLLLKPAENVYEVCARGVNVTPGYYKRPDLTAAAFDDEGFFRTGDTATLADPGDATAGLEFGGRSSENFKLTTGTFVRVGTLRPQLLSSSHSLIDDAIICGENSDYVTAMIWLSKAHASRVTADGAPEQSLRKELVAILDQLASATEGSSRRIERLLVLTEPPKLDTGELTDKGYINQRTTRQRRAARVALLYEDPPPPQVVIRLQA